MELWSCQEPSLFLETDRLLPLLHRTMKIGVPFAALYPPSYALFTPLVRPEEPEERPPEPEEDELPPVLP